MSALRDLLVSFDIDVGAAQSALKGLHKNVETAKNAFESIGEFLIGGELARGFKEFIGSQIEIGSQVNDTAEKLGVGTDELQEFQLAAKLSGVEAESAAQALNFLNKNIGGALDGGKEQAQVFQKLGIQLKDSGGKVRELGDIIPELADGFEKLESPQERTATAMKIFGKSGAALVPLLKDGSKGLKELHARFIELGGGMQKDFIAAADKAGDEIDLLKFGFQGLKSRIAVAVLPVVTDLVMKFQGLVAVVIKITKETNLAKDIMVVFGVISAAAGAKAALSFAQFLGVLPKGAGFWKSVLGLGIWALVALAVIAVGLVVEDLVTLFSGGDSAIGRFVDDLFGIGTAAEGVALFQGVLTHLGEAWDEVKIKAAEFGNAISFMAAQFGISIPGGNEFLHWLRDEFVVAVHGAIDIVEKLVSGILKVATVGARVIGKVASVFGRDSADTLAGAVNNPQSLTNLGSTPAPVTIPSSHVQERGVPSVNAPTNLNGGIHINVNGALVNNETGKAVAGAVKGIVGQSDLNAAAAAVKGDTQLHSVR